MNYQAIICAIEALTDTVEGLNIITPPTYALFFYKEENIYLAVPIHFTESTTVSVLNKYGSLCSVNQVVEFIRLLDFIQHECNPYKACNELNKELGVSAKKFIIREFI